MISAGLAILGAAASLGTHAAPSAVLVTPDNQSVGGQWQQWVQEMKVPTIAGPLTFTTPQALGCGGAAGCSQGAPASWYPGHIQAPPTISASDKWSLYFELGHQFDFRYLTTRDRRWLARFWRSKARWADSMKSLDAGSEDGLEGQFAYAYATCAETGDYFPNSGWPVPMINPRNASGTCAFIDLVAAQATSY